MATLQENLIRWTTDEIEDLKRLVAKYAGEADAHQEDVDRFTSAKHADQEASKTSKHWRNFYQQKEGHCRQQLFKRQIELRKLQAAT